MNIENKAIFAVFENIPIDSGHKPTELIFKVLEFNFSLRNQFNRKLKKISYSHLKQIA